MNGAVARATIRERGSGVVNLAFVALMLALPSLTSREALTPADSIVAQLGLTLVVCAGAIGRELSAGTLALVFCRPIRRSDYVITKWVTLASLALGWGLVQLGAQWIVCTVSGSHVLVATVGQNVFERVACAYGVAAVVVLFSTFTRGSLDVVAWIVAEITASLAAASDHHWLKTFGDELRADLAPHIPYWHTFHSLPIAWSALFGYGATICICLSLASFVMGRKEVSYGT